MMNHDEYDDDQIAWCPVTDMDGNVIGQAGAPKEMVIGRLAYVEGWGMQWVTVPMQVEFGGKKVKSVLPALLFSTPDYPSPETVTYLIYLDDAERMFRKGLAVVDEARRDLKRHVRIQTKKNRREEAALRRLEAEAMSCSHPDCRKQRRFFDADGKGWCKKHAEQLGIREHGKV
jgi:hypothetical protein